LRSFAVPTRSPVAASVAHTSTVAPASGRLLGALPALLSTP